MKTKKIIFTFILTILTVLAFVTFFSCDNPISLGTRLDITGPVVTIISPSQRQTVPVKFDIEGTFDDDSDIDRLLVKADTTIIDNGAPKTLDFARQWRYKTGWEVSDDYGATWSPYQNAVWNGTSKKASWKLSVDMIINGLVPNEGEYTFSIQAWDKGDFTDDNSFKAIVLIIDLNPPKVSVNNPYLYTAKNAYEIPPLKALHDFDDLDTDWQDSAYLGKFITQEFSLKWQIEDSNDVWSIDLRFYEHDAYIDNNPNTKLPDDYIYRYHENLPSPPPAGTNPSDFIKLNGSVTVPDLDVAPCSYNTEKGEGELKNPITEKTTIKVVAVCYDAAGNPNQEKTLGYFISWPKANSPWIEFTAGIKEPYNADKTLNTTLEQDVFMVYPGRSIKATAFQAHGVKYVKYSLYKCNTKDTTLHVPNYADDAAFPLEKIAIDQVIPNKDYGGSYSTIFPWEFASPQFTGYYVFKVQAFTTQDKPSVEYTKLFRVHDITFPDFPVSPRPVATDPLFKAVNSSNVFTLEGIVSDATEIKSLCLVWINPQSREAAANSQLKYFREKDYQGWKDILLKDPSDTPIEEGTWDGNNKNKLWKIPITRLGPGTDNRIRYSYSLDINLATLNIGIDSQPLKSQTFLLRAENPDTKCTIITYAPQGDTSSPVIKIDRVIINEGKIVNGESVQVNCTPGAYAQIEKFKNDDTIKITGTWREDSVEFLDITNYFKKNFDITVNNHPLSWSQISLTEDNDTDGTWTITSTVGTDIPVDKLKDTLVVSVKVKDIGGNTADVGSSWLIKTDNLRLNRISSENADGTYKAGDKIDIFLEFSKPVKINEGVDTPVLILNNNPEMRAVYKTSANQNSRQYFEYEVKSGHDVTALNVTGIENSGNYTETYYPFTWNKGAGGEFEEVRITTTTGKDGNGKEGSEPNQYYVRTLPTATSSSDPDYQSTLAAGKSIKIDTTSPTVSSTISNSVGGYYKTGDTIYMTVNFNESVKITGTPQLVLKLSEGVTVNTETSDIKVNGSSLTFKYDVKSGNTSLGNAVIVNGYLSTDANKITDLAGNPLTNDGISNLVGTQLKTNNVNVCIETRKPDSPVVKVLKSTSTTDFVTNDVYVSGTKTTHKGLSTDANKSLNNLYNTNLYLAIEGKGDDYQYDIIEYSIIDSTTPSWVKYDYASNTAFQLSKNGSNKIIARQKDKAGNTSDPSAPITFNWDPGTLVSRISSASANGIYNHNTPNTITITVYFRKNISITGTPSIGLNVMKDGSYNGTSWSGGSARTLTALSANNVPSLSFTYTVENNDYIPSNAILNISSIAISAIDGATTANGVDVSSMINLPTPSFDNTKEFTIETGSLSQTPAMSFAGNSGTEGNDNFHGIKSDDGSYWTTLIIPFNHAISKGSGNITITQIAGSGNTAYRLPAVLTEAQYKRFKGNSSLSTSIDTYYIKGTNGYSNTAGASDTTTKYILQYNYNPNSSVTANNSAFTGDAFVPSEFIGYFRTAEAITIPVNAQAVTITNSTGGNTGTLNNLRIRLTGSNAPQVPGASYTVNLPAGAVVDGIGNTSILINENVTLGGVAKPFVRIRKTQDTITTQAGSANAPRLVAAQPFQSYARMDCRTPNANIYFAANSGKTTVNAVNWGTGKYGTGNAYGGTINSDRDGPLDTNTVVASRPTDVEANTRFGTHYTTTNAQITLSTNDEYEGYVWWVRAKADIENTTFSTETEEKAYKTVITLQVRNGTGAITAGDNNESTMLGIYQNTNLTGTQIWIRGGDAIGSSSIPGFPFTWEDNWMGTSADWANKRAGIRLMTKTNNTSSLNNSEWKFITWEINATAYVDFIMGNDTSSTANIAWQYGPIQSAYTRSGWTSFKIKYPIYPGKHRWCDMGGDWAGKYAMNFSATFHDRPTTAPFNANNYSRWPGLNIK